VAAGIIIGVLGTLGGEALLGLAWWMWLNSKSDDSTS
jgi:hypothetical protein